MKKIKNYLKTVKNSDKTSLKSLLKHELTDETGQNFVEYVLLVALIAILLITIILVFKDKIVALFNHIISALTDGADGKAPSGDSGSGDGDNGGEMAATILASLLL